MTAYESFIAFVVGPIFLVACWIAVLRVWRRGMDLTAGNPAVGMLTRSSSAATGLHAFLLPTVCAASLMWLAAAVFQPLAESGVGPDWFDLVVNLAYLGGLLLLGLGLWMSVFAWPRFLVPPHMRDELTIRERRRQLRESRAAMRASRGSTPGGRRRRVDR